MIEPAQPRSSRWVLFASGPAQGGILTPVLKIQLLGGFAVEAGGPAAVEFDSARLQSLLVYVLLHRQEPVARQHLAFLLWPDSPETQARANLRNLLHRLGELWPAGRNYVSVTPSSVQWRSDAAYTLDVAEFDAHLRQAEGAGEDEARLEHLRRALQLYRGALLPGFYDEWLLPERSRLERAFVQALQQIVELLGRRHDYAAAIQYERRLVEQEPLREAGYRQLMRLHAQAGDRASALHVYHTCATLLMAELSVGPSAATDALRDQLLSAGSAPALPPLAVRAPLVGRQREREGLVAAWQALAAGKLPAQFVLITGEAGAGKTRLAEDLLAQVARQGAVAARAACYAAQAHQPFAPVAAWLRALPLERLAEPWKSEVARPIPEMGAAPPAGEAPLGETWQRQRLFEALARAILGQRQPVLLLLDDLQWCDPDTLEWLQFLFRFDRSARLLVLATARAEDLEAVQAAAAPLCGALQRRGQYQELTLGRLDEAETAQLAAHLLGRGLNAAEHAALYAGAEGNPFFIVEWVRSGLPPAGGPGQVEPEIASSLPPRIAALLQTRLAQLSYDARDLLNAAAVVGREFSLGVLAAAADLEEDQVMASIDELWRKRVIREQGRAAYDFSHDNLRQLVYERLSLAAGGCGALRGRPDQGRPVGVSRSRRRGPGRPFPLGRSPDAIVVPINDGARPH